VATIKHTLIRKLRKEQKMSQEVLADKAKIGRSYVAKIELGIYEPSLATLKRIAKALGIDYKELLI
jgi:transcriptional regulator with XRE-family HTH domain